MLRRLAGFLAVIVFLAMLLTLVAYLWAPSKSVRFEREPAPPPAADGVATP